jgi:hypothetical protein
VCLHPFAFSCSLAQPACQSQRNREERRTGEASERGGEGKGTATLVRPAARPDQLPLLPRNRWPSCFPPSSLSVARMRVVRTI